MGRPDLGIDFFLTTIPWCTKLDDYARDIGVEIEESEDLND